jgi:hypothetical protein
LGRFPDKRRDIDTTCPMGDIGMTALSVVFMLSLPAPPARFRDGARASRRPQHRIRRSHATCRRGRENESFPRDHEYRRHGVLSLLTGKVHAGVEERHRSWEFVKFLKRRDAAYPAQTAIKY